MITSPRHVLTVHQISRVARTLVHEGNTHASGSMQMDWHGTGSCLPNQKDFFKAVWITKKFWLSYCRLSTDCLHFLFVPFIKLDPSDTTVTLHSTAKSFSRMDAGRVILYTHNAAEWSRGTCRSDP